MGSPRMLLRHLSAASVAGILLFCGIGDGRGSTPDVQRIIQRSVEANQRDFQAAPQFSHTERDRTGSGSKTYRVLMIEGSPYQQLVAVNGKPLSPQAAQDEVRKLQRAKSERKAESSDERKRRIDKYQSDRHRNNEMMQQLTKAFDFTLVGEGKLNSFKVYILRARPRQGYQPPNLETQVLPAMQGMLWIDEATYQWVKVTAKVIRPASIEGFLAQVEPGTQFELEKMPVGDGVWQPKHFSMKSEAKVLYMFSHDSQEEDVFSDYRRAN